MEINWKIKQTVFSKHAVTQMFSRSISIDVVKAIVSHHEVLADYPDDKPYPSRLLLGFVDEIPFHLVLGYNASAGVGYVITAYKPDPLQWGDDFKRRKTS